MKRLSGGAIDQFRLVAAVLVVAIHTAPLQQLDPTAAMIVTDILARVAVPFFLMVSGYFLLPELVLGERIGQLHFMKNGKLWRFFTKTMLLYLLASLLYLPINLYAGHWLEAPWWGQLLKVTCFEGTFYHLWYLPAALVGIVLVCSLLRFLTIAEALVIAVLLYLIGLLGDSYYGLIVQFSWMQAFYEGLFACMDYTRNGLFYAPVFLLLGGWIGLQPGLPNKTYLWANLTLVLGLLVGEGLVLHWLQWPRHDSMYLLLLPVMYYLFLVVLSQPGRSNQDARQVSMLIYILHPLLIIIVRGFAKIFGWQQWMIENNLLHFLLVLVSTWLLSSLLNHGLHYFADKKNHISE